MNIFIEHDAATLARLAGSSRPHCDGVILKHREPDVVLASTLRGNPFSDDWLIDVDCPGRRIVSWSGTLAEGLFDRHGLNWMAPGAQRLDAWCRELRDQLRNHDRMVCVQPHSRHVLSDAQSCLGFLRRHEGEPFEIAFSPATMLEPSMLGDVEDHLTRMFESLGDRCPIMCLSDIRVVVESDEAACECVPLGDGVLPRALILRLCSQFVPDDTPVVISAAKISQQLAWLGCG